MKAVLNIHKKDNTNEGLVSALPIFYSACCSEQVTGSSCLSLHHCYCMGQGPKSELSAVEIIFFTSGFRIEEFSHSTPVIFVLMPISLG